MGTPGPQKIKRYGIAFKLKAVQMSNAGVQQGLARCAAAAATPLAFSCKCCLDIRNCCYSTCMMHPPKEADEIAVASQTRSWLASKTRAD